MSKFKQATAYSELVKPTVAIAGHTNEFKASFGPNTELTAIGYTRISERSNAYVSYKLHIKGNEVVGIEVSEPNLRLIAEESAKIDFVNAFTDKE